MITPKRMKFYGIKQIDNIPQLRMLNKEERFALKVVAAVLPFRINNYVIEELIDWSNVPDDPIYQLTFMQKELLSDDQFNRMAHAIQNNFTESEIKYLADKIRVELNPHPAAQMSVNIPKINDIPIPGMQHKYRETALIFPSSGQTCHAYCTFCFRWAQFVGMKNLKFATEESKYFQDYLKKNKQITDILLTGGDPMIMNLKNLKAYIEPLLSSEFVHIRNIRIGTKSVAYWPYKYVTDPDADGILRLFEKIIRSGKHLAIMGHYNHWVELSTEIAQEAIKRIRGTGAEIRTQSPLVKHINDDPEIWAKMWEDQVALGCIPYYFFVERNTGAKNYFELPLVETYNIFRDAFTKVSGLSRTVRGPSMSALPGKVVIEGITEVRREKTFVLNLIQARNPEWVKKPFFAKYDPNAKWYTDLKPAFGENKFFFQDELEEIIDSNHGQLFFQNDYPEETFVQDSEMAN